MRRLTRRLLQAVLASAVLLLWGVGTTRGDLTINFGGSEFDKNTNPFSGDNRRLFLNDGGDWVPNIGPNNELAIKSIDDTKPVVVERTLTVLINGTATDVDGVALTNIQLKAQKALTNFVITVTDTRNFANPLTAGGVKLFDDSVTYAAEGTHSTSITLSGDVDGTAIGSVTQTDKTAGAGTFNLLPANASDGALLGLPAGKHTITLKLDITMEQNAILTLPHSAEGGVQDLPEPPTLAAFALGSLAFLGRRSLKRLALPA
jgi:hypothetical protein